MRKRSGDSSELVVLLVLMFVAVLLATTSRLSTHARSDFMTRLTKLYEMPAITRCQSSPPSSMAADLAAGVYGWE